MCAENAATASDEQPDSHYCKRVFCVAGAGIGMGQGGWPLGVVVTSQPCCRNHLLVYWMGLREKSAGAYHPTTNTAAESKTKRCIYSCLLSACAWEKRDHCLRSNNVLALFLRAPKCNDLFYEHRRRRRRSAAPAKGCKSEARGNNIGFYYCRELPLLSIWSLLSGRWMENGATAAAHYSRILSCDASNGHIQ